MSSLSQPPPTQNSYHNSQFPPLSRIDSAANESSVHQAVEEHTQKVDAVVEEVEEKKRKKFEAMVPKDLTVAPGGGK